MSESGTKRRRRDWLDLGLIGSAHGLSDGYSNLLVPVLALIVAELGLSTVRTGTLLSIFSLATFVFLYPLSVAADHSGSKRTFLIVGLALASASYFAMQWAGGFTVLAVLAFLAGAGNAAYHPCGTALTAERFRHRRAFAISLHGLMGNLGAAVMPVVQAVVATAAGWRLALAVCTLPALLILPLVGIRFPRGERANLATGRTLSSLRMLTSMVIGNRDIVLLALVYALQGMATKTMIGFFPLLASDRFGMQTSLIGIALTLYFLMGVGAKPLMGLIYSRWGARTALFVPLAISGVIALLIGLVSWPSALLLLMAVAGLAMPISPIILTAAADRSAKESLASAVGFIYTLNGLGFIAPAIGGWLAQESGMTANYVFAAVLIWLSALTALMLSRKRALAPRRQLAGQQGAGAAGGCIQPPAAP